MSHILDHSKVLSGRCKVCGHHGQDCTGSDCMRMADYGCFAVQAYINKYGMQREDLATVVSDLLGDLMHYCDQMAVDFSSELERAEGHYKTEVWEDAERRKELVSQ